MKAEDIFPGMRVVIRPSSELAELDRAGRLPFGWNPRMAQYSGLEFTVRTKREIVNRCKIVFEDPLPGMENWTWGAEMVEPAQSQRPLCEISQLDIQELML